MKVATRHQRESSRARECEKLCVAVLGTGSVGMRHLEVLARLEGVRPIAVPTRPERLHELQRVGYFLASNVEAAAEQGATLAIIATDTARHVEDGLAALAGGCDLLVEKPIGVDAGEARRLCEQASRLGRAMYVACVLRFSDSLNTFRRLLKEVGRLHSVRIECQSYLPDWRPARPYKDSYSARADEGGVLRDLIHDIDYAGWLFGWPSAVQASIRNMGRLGIKADEAAELMWQTRERCVVSLSLDYLSRPSHRRMRASGERGTLEWDGVEGSVTLVLVDSPSRVIRSTQTREAMLLEQTRTFLKATRGPIDPQLASAEDGVRALAVCDAARLASDNRREVRVDSS